MDLNQVKKDRLRDINNVLNGVIKLEPEVIKVLNKYKKPVEKLLPTQILTLTNYTPEEVELLMQLLTNKKFIAPQPGSQETLLNSTTDITLYGGAAGSGKTVAILMDALQHKDDPNYYAVFFRKNTTQLTGGLWPAAKKLYGMFGGVPLEQKMTIQFPSGASIKFSYMELEKHAEAHQGIEYSAIYWDEFTHFSQSQVDYLMTRMRSGAAGDSYMKCSMNPDRDHFVYAWVEPFLTEDGYPDPDLCGKTRWFVLQEGVMYSDWDRDVILRDFPLEIPQTYTFISGTIDDNPLLDFIEPKYRGRLENNTPINVARLRYGNWKARAEGASYFDRKWCEIIDAVEEKTKVVRAWDLAATLPSELNPNPDWTAGVRMSKGLKTGTFYVEHVKRFRDRPAGVEEGIKDTAKADTNKTEIFIPQDPGAAGKSYASGLIRKLAVAGFRARARTTNKDKVTRFAPFSAVAEAGLVKVVRGDWNDAFFAELEAFTGDGKKKDDQVDATSDAFQSLNTSRSMTVPKMNSNLDMMRANPFEGLKTM